MRKEELQKVQMWLLEFSNGNFKDSGGWSLASDIQEFVGLDFDSVFGLVYASDCTPGPCTQHARRIYAGIIAAAIEAGDLP